MPSISILPSRYYCCFVLHNPTSSFLAERGAAISNYSPSLQMSLNEVICAQDPNRQPPPSRDRGNRGGSPPRGRSPSSSHRSVLPTGRRTRTPDPHPWGIYAPTLTEEPVVGFAGRILFILLGLSRILVIEQVLIRIGPKRTDPGLDIFKGLECFILETFH